MKTLPQILKNWSLEKQVLTSPPIRDKREYKQIKDLLTRAMVRAEYIDAQNIIKISVNPNDSPGKTNVERMEKMNLSWG